MKILIIGKNSYIGNHIDEWLTKYGHKGEQLDVLTEDWRAYDYSPYDAIVHVAGIVHRPDCQDWKLYKSVNTDLPVQIAKLFKASLGSSSSNGLEPSEAIEQIEQTKSLNSSSAALNNLNGSSAALNQPKVKTFVFFSTMGVYEAGKKLGPSVVDENTPLLNEGNSMYGRSKVLAEIGLSDLQDGKFNVAIVRPPSVYGKGCKGGYITGFKKIASMLPIIPRAYENACQSFIYIDNLSECVRLIVENNLSGAFCPQDDETPNANRLLEVICKGIGKKYRSSRLLGWCLRLISFVPIVKKAYGGIEYSRKLSDIPGMNYVVVPFEEGMRRTVN